MGVHAHKHYIHSTSQRTHSSMYIYITVKCVTVHGNYYRTASDAATLVGLYYCETVLETKSNENNRHTL